MVFLHMQMHEPISSAGTHSSNLQQTYLVHMMTGSSNAPDTMGWVWRFFGVRSILYPNLLDRFSWWLSRSSGVWVWISKFRVNAFAHYMACIDLLCTHASFLPWALDEHALIVPWWENTHGDLGAEKGNLKQKPRNKDYHIFSVLISKI